MTTFAALDWLVLGAYFLVIFGVAIWSGRGEKNASSQGYFLAGKNVGWFVVGASIFASNIGSEHLVGLAGAGAAGGIPVAQFEILAGFVLLLLGWLFVPFYISSGVFTMPEFLEKRYSAGPRMYLAIISVAGYVLTKIAVTIAAGGIVFETLLGINFWTGALIVVVATGIYTLWGGLRAVLYTDMVQMFVLIGGALAVTWLGLRAIGGWGALTESVPDDYFSLWRAASHPEFPWTGILFGAPILAVWYWCTDQFIVQRALSARSVTDARRGAIFAAFLKQLPLFFFVLPGVIAFALYESGQLGYDKPDQALPALVGALLPAGLKGLVAAGLLAALMSSLSSVFSSCATLFSIDIYKKYVPAASDRHLVTVGRIAVAVTVVLGLLWIPYIDLVSGQLFTYLQSVQAYISPPIAAIFLVGVLWKGATARGAVATLAVGFVLGFGRLMAEVNKASLSGPLLAFTEINFLHFAAMLFVVCVATLVAVSAAGSQRVGTVPVLFDSKDIGDRGRTVDAVLSVILVIIVLSIWFIFS